MFCVDHDFFHLLELHLTMVPRPFPPCLRHPSYPEHPAKDNALKQQSFPQQMLPEPINPHNSVTYDGLVPWKRPTLVTSPVCFFSLLKQMVQVGVIDGYELLTFLDPPSIWFSAHR